jgi:hypothetical protein
MLKIQFPDFGAVLGEAGQRLQAERQTLLRLLGIDLLGLAQQAYVEKARGGTGSDGIAWAPLSRATIEARVRSRAPAQQIVAQRKQLAEQIRNTTGKGAAARIEALRKKRAALSAKLQALVDREFSRHEIGVDTGLQRASGGPGYRGPDNKGGNLFDVQEHSLTIGYGREYSGYFDEKRPLLPEQLPPAWLEVLERRAADWGATILSETMN